MMITPSRPTLPGLRYPRTLCAARRLVHVARRGRRRACVRAVGGGAVPPTPTGVSTICGTSFVLSAFSPSFIPRLFRPRRTCAWAPEARLAPNLLPLPYEMRISAPRFLAPRGADTQPANGRTVIVALLVKPNRCLGSPGGIWGVGWVQAHMCSTYVDLRGRISSDGIASDLIPFVYHQLECSLAPRPPSSPSPSHSPALATPRVSTPLPPGKPMLGQGARRGELGAQYPVIYMHMYTYMPKKLRNLQASQPSRRRCGEFIK